MDEVHIKNKLDTIRFRHNKVNFKVKYEDHKKCSNTYFILFLNALIDNMLHIILY